LGEVVEKAANKSVITRTSADPMVDYEPIHQVLDGFQKPESAQIIPNRFKAIQWVLDQAQPGDAVLISGCGERPFALVGEHHWTIADRDVCQAWLYDNASMLTEKFEKPPSIYKIDDYRS
jgi:UDP-N-acetylmuramoyl-L-alanyl-D-glutamate--2,6-diaminopimelate ligase